MDSGSRFNKSNGPKISLPIAASLNKQNSNNNYNDEWYVLELPHTYQIHQGEKWSVSLNSASFFFDNIDCESKVINILLRELKNGLFASGDSNILCSISNIEENGSAHFESERKRYNLFQSNSLNSLSFQFIDDVGKLLKLNSKPSFVHLSIETMATEEYQIQLSGTIAKNETEITFNLPNHVNLGAGNWKLACSNICLPPISQDDELSIRISQEKSSEHFILNEGTSLGNLLFEINEKLAKVLGSNKAFIVPHEDKISIDVYVKSELQISRKLALILGFKNDVVKGGLILTFPEAMSIIPENNPDISRTVPQSHVMLITCDVIDTIIFNNTYKPILKILPIKTSDSVTFYEAKNLDFVDIVPSTLSSITMTFENEDGLPVYFKPDMRISTCLTIVRT